MTLLRLCPQAEPTLNPISAKLADVTMVEAELTLGRDDQDTEGGTSASKEGRGKMHTMGLTYRICLLSALCPAVSLVPGTQCTLSTNLLNKSVSER